MGASTSVSVYLLRLFLLSLIFAFSSASSAIEETCHGVQAVYVRFDFCVSSLQAAPGSASADRRGLTGIAVSLVAANATDIEAKLVKLLKNSSDPDYRNCLEGCRGMYGEAILSAKRPEEAFVSRRFGDARGAILDALDANRCNELYCKDAIAPSLDKEKTDFENLATMSNFLIQYFG